MSAPSTLVKRATDLLAEDSIDRIAGERASSDDEAMIGILGATIEREALRRRRRRIAVAAAGALSVAAAVALLAGARASDRSAQVATTRLPSAHVAALADGAKIVHADKASPIESGTTISSGDRVLSGHGRAAISLSTGTHLVVEDDADLGVRSLGSIQSFDLRAGALRADVAKLGPNERFVVHTRDAEVEVRGTSFRVALVPRDPGCRGGTITRVSVTEGDVVVRTSSSEEHVLANGAWPPECTRGVEVSPIVSPAPDAPAMAPVRSAPVTPTPSGSPKAPSTPATSSASAPEASQLAAQNALFAEAKAARRHGDDVRAIERYEELARRYPASALAESALVERMRLLSARDSRVGAAAAREYLVRYPHGFARDEAARLAARDR